jgi:hypothetical protein
MTARTVHFCLTVCAALTATAPCAVAASRGAPWKIRTIDDSSRGADGVKLGDLDADGALDIATGWEEGGVTRVYLHPAGQHVRRPQAVARGDRRQDEVG